jgi:hypothetical protein
MMRGRSACWFEARTASLAVGLGALAFPPSADMSRLAQLKSDVQDLRLAPYGKRESTFPKNLQHRSIIRQDFSNQLPDPG